MTGTVAFIIGSGQIGVSPEKAPKFLSVEATTPNAHLLRIGGGGLQVSCGAQGQRLRFWG